MSIMTLNAKLDRTDNRTPWGFRLHGGIDFGAQLSIQRVNPGSLAAKCGVQVGDAIMKIGGAPTDGMKHKDAQQHIMSCGNSLELTLQRGGGLRAAAPAPAAAPPAPVAPPAAPVVPPPAPASSMYQQPSNKPFGQGYNVGPKPFASSGPKPYGSPKSYGSDVDGLAGQTSQMSIGQSQPGTTGPVKESSGLGFQILHDVGNSEARSQSPSFGGVHTKQTPPTQSARYEEHPGDDVPKYRGYQNPSYQSRSFKLLQNMVDTGEDVTGSGNLQQPAQPQYKAPSPVPQQYKSPSPVPPPPSTVPREETDPASKFAKSIVNVQYNTPSVLYSNNNVQKSYNQQSDVILSSQERTPKSDEVIADERKKIYIPSATFKMVQEADSGKVPKELDSGLKSHVPPENTRIVQSGPESLDDKDSAGKIIQSETYKAVHESPSKTSNSNPIHSRSFQMLQKQLDQPGGMTPAAPKPAPASAPAPAPAAASTWQPKIPVGPRTPKVGRKGDARSMPGVIGGARIPICSACGSAIRGPFVTALDKTWCPDHFLCANPQCRVQLIDMEFVVEDGQLFCIRDYEQYFAPRCGKCGQAIVGDYVTALEGYYHPACFVCTHCRQPINAGAYHVHDGEPYCTTDWAALYQTKCYGCNFPIEPGDRWVEALNQNWHSECFNCSTCQVSLEGQSFFAKGGRPYCKRHAQ